MITTNLKTVQTSTLSYVPSTVLPFTESERKESSTVPTLVILVIPYLNLQFIHSYCTSTRAWLQQQPPPPCPLLNTVQYSTSPNHTSPNISTIPYYSTRPGIEIEILSSIIHTFIHTYIHTGTYIHKCMHTCLYYKKRGLYLNYVSRPWPRPQVEKSRNKKSKKKTDARTQASKQDLCGEGRGFCLN
ncbi:hypothetical protein L873DRAFT_578627 [Choiromyces venosus 120613-1]|uniref:Uncharacterized protein n=1 Tax=Choiromyces venosus 120613-1 TaxID=1336337 RepID=A0A3N4J7P6_9PEZI|nr:hypothetical protein L873DRAFT_578627 [Choiromyces venosus 120613-1]